MSSFLPSDNADTAGNLENQPAPVDLANQQLKILSPDPRKPRTSRFSPLCASSGGSGHTASNASNPSSAASTPGARFAQRFHVSASSPSPISALSHSHHISTGSSSSSEDTAATRTSISTSISISTTGHSNTTVSGASTISTAPAPTATATAPTPLSTFSPVLSTPVSRPPHRTPLTQSHTPSRAPHTPSRTLHTPSHTPHTPTPATPTSTPHSQPTPATPELFSSPESTRHRRRKTPGWINNHAWRLGEKIGSGSFGEVYQGQRLGCSVWGVGLNSYLCLYMIPTYHPIPPTLTCSCSCPTL
ncbi:hypothetical protein B484DRAFT_92357 [Ochromonadaceae sp. CCMP2298]|nr:hypothetical protein B484DRAFT_92357 [Ochromonadaceae sp. CCMP2298]